MTPNQGYSERQRAVAVPWFQADLTLRRSAFFIEIINCPGAGR